MRSVQKQNAWSARAQMTMTVVMVVMLAGFFLFGFRPAQSRQSELRQQIGQRTKELENAQSRAKNLPALANEVLTLENKLSNFNKRLPKTVELDNFLRDMTRVKERYELKKLVHQTGQVKRLDLFGEIPITMTFEGDFTNVFSFMRDLEGIDRLTRVKSITIRQKDPKLGLVDVTLAMNIYFSEL